MFLTTIKSRQAVEGNICLWLEDCIPAYLWLGWLSQSILTCQWGCAGLSRREGLLLHRGPVGIAGVSTQLLSTWPGAVPLWMVAYGLVRRLTKLVKKEAWLRCVVVVLELRQGNPSRLRRISASARRVPLHQLLEQFMRSSAAISAGIQIL